MVIRGILLFYLPKTKQLSMLFGSWRIYNHYISKFVFLKKKRAGALPITIRRRKTPGSTPKLSYLTTRPDLGSCQQKEKQKKAGMNTSSQQGTETQTAPKNNYKKTTT